jgi:hypothetical protein
MTDPTVPFTEITIDGTTYKMSLDLESLATVEEELIAKGQDVNLFASLPKMNLSNVRLVFAASLRKFQPEIPFDEAIRILTLPHLYEAGAAIGKAWNDTLSPPEEGEESDPTKPLSAGESAGDDSGPSQDSNSD